MVARLKITVPAIALVYDKKVLRQTLRTAGSEVAAGARRLIRSSAGGGKVYYGSGGGASAAFRGGYKKGRYRASTAGQAPVSVTGTLLRSIKVRPFKSGEGVTVRDTAYYALALEVGARGGGGNRFGGNLIPAGTILKNGRVLGHNRLKSGAIAKNRILARRPFLTAALAMRESDLTQRVGAAATAGVRMQRLTAAAQKAMVAGKK
jgi:hypothetical protein